MFLRLRMVLLASSERDTLSIRQGAGQGLEGISGQLYLCSANDARVEPSGPDSCTLAWQELGSGRQGCVVWQ